MNSQLWVSIRDYIDIEIRLNILRHTNETEVACNNRLVRELDAQSSAVESTIRQHIEELEARVNSIATLAARADAKADPRHAESHRNY